MGLAAMAEICQLLHGNPLGKVLTNVLCGVGEDGILIGIIVASSGRIAGGFHGVIGKG